MEQQTARALGRVVELVGLKIFRNIGVDEEEIAVFFGGVALADCGLARAERFDLRTGQRNASLEHFANRVIETRFAVIGGYSGIAFWCGCHCGGVALQALVRPANAMALRMMARVGSVVGTMGRRTSSVMRPSTESAYFGPAGLGSTNRAEWSGKSLS